MAAGKLDYITRDKSTKGRKMVGKTGREELLHAKYHQFARAWVRLIKRVENRIPSPLELAHAILTGRTSREVAASAEAPPTRIIRHKNGPMENGQMWSEYLGEALVILDQEKAKAIKSRLDTAQLQKEIRTVKIPGWVFDRVISGAFTTQDVCDTFSIEPATYDSWEITYKKLVESHRYA